MVLLDVARTKAVSTAFLILLLIPAGLSQPATTPNSQSVELEYELPEKTADPCRSHIASMSDEYEERIREQPGREAELREEFYEKVGKELESCDPAPRLVNVSEAPPSIPAACKERMEALNEEIRSETNRSVGSRVPEQYKTEYETVLKGCVAGAAVEKLESRMEAKLFGDNPNKSNLLVRLFHGFFDRVKRLVIRNPSAAKTAGFNSSVTPTEQENRFGSGMLPDMLD